MFIPLKKLQQISTQHCITPFMGSTEETGNSHLPLIGYNSKTPPISSPTPSNFRIVMWRRPVEEIKFCVSSDLCACLWAGCHFISQVYAC